MLVKVSNYGSLICIQRVRLQIGCNFIINMYKLYSGDGKMLSILINRGSYMSAHVLLNLLNKLRKRNKMQGLLSILSLFPNEFNKFNNTIARVLDSIYHMTLRLL